MRVMYGNKKLERVCTDQKLCRREYPKLHKKIAMRHNALEIAQSMSDLCRIDPGGRWHDLKGDRAGEWAGSINGNYRMIVIPTELGPEVTSVEKIEVKVAKIEDYH